MTTLSLAPDRSRPASRAGAPPGALRLAVAAEVARTRTTRTVLWLGLAGALLAAVMTAMVAATIGQPGGQEVASETGRLTVLSFGFSAGLMATLVGVLSVASERRYRTMGSSLVATPSRRNWLLAKALVVVPIGLVFTTVGQAVALAIGAPVLSSHGAHVDLWSGPALQMTIGTLTLGAFSAVWGVALGALIRNQMVAVAAVTLYSIMVEAAVIQYVPAVGKWLPGGAQSAIVHDPATEHLSAGAGYLVFAAWCTVGLLLAIRQVAREDVTVSAT
ncbi:hypothetical protein [Motilibacter deserti]|uniref:ABC-2 type transport system permease protein n=1 Tax=Motilibacter deserti TaxID=2714956 RepID=A0ABX0GYX7_9ACTN|nr:hypothetical protein [Motilibacter deserti]NHC16144.1 hypothetical protein [Motilibacter deserti]